ncbi:MAG: hypothetical protein ABI772_00900 [Bacteroidota bacterium]
MSLFIKIFRLTVMFTCTFCSFSKAVIKTSTGTGNWSSNETWTPSGIPASGDDIIIASGHIVTVNVNTTCKTIIVQSSAVLNFTESKSLTLTGACTINGTCNVSGGALLQSTTGAAFNLGDGSFFEWNPASNTIANATIFTNSTENFYAGSTITFSKWYDTSVSLGSVVTGNFGNIIFKTRSGGWSQKNTFATHPVSGTLTIDGDYIILDDVNSATPETVTINNIILASADSYLDFFTGTRSGDLTINTGNITISKGELNLLNRSGKANCTLNVSGNILIEKDGILSGANNNNGNSVFNVTGNFTVNGGKFYGSYEGDGNNTVNVTGNFNNNISTNAGEYYGCIDGNGNASLTVNGNLVNSGYLDLIWNSGITGVGNGNGTLTVNGNFIQSQGDFRGIFNLTTTNAGKVNLTFSNIIYTGGIFIANYSCNNNPVTNYITVSGNIDITFSASTDIFRGNGLSTLTGTSNNAALMMNVAGNISISGNASGEFRTNAGNGSETVTVGGNTAFNGGTNYFNYSTAHNSIITFTGNVTATGGKTYLSYSPGNASIVINGNLDLSGGTISLKDNTGVSSLLVNGSFTQTAGTIYIYGSNGIISADESSLIITGSFTQSGGTLNFNNNPSSVVSNNVYINSSDFNLGGTGVITSSVTSSGNYFGKLYFTRAGTTNYVRTPDHLTEKVKIYITNGTTLLPSSSVQVASASTAATDMLNLNSGSTLDLGSNKIISNRINSHSGINILAGSTFKTAHPQGFYNNTSNAALDASGAMDYFIDAYGTVEYNGYESQVVTGSGAGIANGTQHKYGILKINFGGTTEKVNIKLADDAYVRTQLSLMNGELFLNDHALTVESGFTSAITRNNGYIKSESASPSGNATVNWKNTTEGTYIFPFGYNSSNYIPVKISLTSGGPADISISTRSTEQDNKPWASGVTNINNNSSDISAVAVIDRWWNITASSPVTTDITLSYRGSENTTGSPSSLFCMQTFNAGNWETSAGNATGVTSGTGTITATGISRFGPVVIIASSYTLPVELAYFTVQPSDNNADVKWCTSSEKNIDYFIVQKSTDGINWVDVQKVKGSGNSVVMKYYEVQDNNPLPGKSFYRLQQTDLNTSSTFSASRPFFADQHDKKTENAITGISPNPFTSAFTMQFVMDDEGEGDIYINSAKGEVIYKSKIHVLKGINYFDYKETADLLPGYYTITLVKGTTQLSRKIIKSN